MQRPKKKRKIEEKSNSVTATRQQPDHAYLVNGTLPDEILVHIDSYLSALRDKSSFTQTCVHLHSIFQPPLNETAYKRLAQAVIDDNRNTIKKLLDSNPSLVFYTPSMSIEIESKLTWQQFSLTENALTIAVKRKQIDVLAFLLPYCDQCINQIDAAAAKEQALSAWTFYTLETIQSGEEKIVIPDNYVDYAQGLVDVFKQETFPDGKLSKHTEAAVASLFESVLSNTAMKLDNYLDPELLLLAIYQTFSNNIYSFNRAHNQILAFHISVTDLIQSIQTPESANIICTILNDFMEANEQEMQNEISVATGEYTLANGESFYRSSRDFLSKLGLEYFVGIDGHAVIQKIPSPFNMPIYLEEAMLSKNNRFLELLRANHKQKQGQNLCDNMLEPRNRHA